MLRILHEAAISVQVSLSAFFFSNQSAMPCTQRVLLVLPPLTQLNTPYPATAYLTGYLRSLGYVVDQLDLGIELIDQLFSRDGVSKIFDEVERIGVLPEDWDGVCDQQARYESTIEPVMRFLRGTEPTLAARIAGGRFLPEGPRFSDAADIDWAFGQIGVRDRARFLATRYLDDLADVIRFGVNPHFAFTRYAESLAISAASYEPLSAALDCPADLIDETMMEIMQRRVQEFEPTVVGFSVPFPGNLYGALRCGRALGESHPGVVRVMGGGYPTTELRSLAEHRVFDAVDHIVLDDGELPLQRLLASLDGDSADLRRTYSRDGELVRYEEGAGPDVAHAAKPPPDYQGLPLHLYLSVLQVPNPMHRLWSDGRWNKLTVAHGCYWGKCSFCDVSLDYIARYDGTNAAHIVDQMEAVAAQTGESGFHFVDEAAPPVALRELAREILARDAVYSWWTNIRFEKSFGRDLCELLAASGCIAVSGGLEVASDRLLAMMKKGVTIDQVARVTSAFSRAGVLVHAYLMYGFPTQTVQETVDALEVVRQLFAADAVQSGFWHRFAMTAHAPVGLSPASFGVEAVGEGTHTFARNDVRHFDPASDNPDALGRGLEAGLNALMRGAGHDRPVYEWFEHPVPPSTESPERIRQALVTESDVVRMHAQPVWLGAEPDWLADPNTDAVAGLAVMGTQEYLTLEMTEQTASVVARLLSESRPAARGRSRLADYLEVLTPSDAASLLVSAAWDALRANGLLFV